MKINQNAPGFLPTPESARAQPETHIARRGETTLTAIARQHGAELRDLIEANPQIRNPDGILPGQEIRLPARVQALQMAGAADDGGGAPPLGGSSPPSAPWPLNVMVDGVVDGFRFAREIHMQTTQIVRLKESAVAAGVPPDKANQLANSLQSLSRKDFQREVRLLDDALASANPDRALRTYLELNPLRTAHPDRITPSTARALVMGVGERRTPATQGKEGILGRDAAVRAAQTLASMPESEFQRIQDALNRAGGVRPASAQTERALILKAVAARAEQLSSPPGIDRARVANGLPALGTFVILGFANQIRGRDSDDLIRWSSVLDLDGDGDDEALQQRWAGSCAPAAAQMTRAEADPIYSFQLHAANKEDGIHSISTSDEIADMEKMILEHHGGTAVLRGREYLGGMNMIPVNPVAGATTDRNYRAYDVADTEGHRLTAMNLMEIMAKLGVDVPIVVERATGSDKREFHALLVSDVRGSSGSREFLVTDPWKGRTAWLSEAAIKGGDTNFIYGTARLFRVYSSHARP